jgi:hypothetical protein
MDKGGTMSAVKFENNKTQVAVFGAGIAGLTAAHELVERGFQVEVYEKVPPSVVDLASGCSVACAVGGMARTQWSRVERPKDGVQPPRPPGHAAQALTVWLPQLILFAEHTASLSDVAGETIDTVADALMEADYRIGHLEIRGFRSRRSHNPPGPHQDAQLVDFQRAEAVLQALVHHLEKRGCTFSRQCAGTAEGAWPTGEPVRIDAYGYGLGYPGDWSKPEAARRCVSFHIVEDWIPGEHGFRFFPSFYRNLFDTMRRTPIPDEDQIVYTESPRTVLDNLLPTTEFGLSTTRFNRMVRFRRQPVVSLQELFDQLCDMLKALGHRLADIERYQAKLFKFMTASPERREKEYEGISWAEFLGAEEFTKPFQHYLESTAEVLIGVEASSCDARTYGNMSLQMVRDQLTTGEHTDSTLNGATSQAWLDHWRRYLESQGVQFHRGELIGFEFSEDKDDHTLKPWPVVKVYRPSSTVASDEDGDCDVRLLMRDYYVAALPAAALQQLVQNEPRLVGEDFQRIRGFPLIDPTHRGQAALDYMEGIQFYFQSDVRYLRGHIIFPDSDWRLSAISQPQFWTQKRGWWSGYRGIVSVDISNFHSQKHPAWGLPRQQVAEEVWRQITATIAKQIPQLADTPDAVEKTIPQPVFYHFDEDFGSSGDEEDDTDELYLRCRAGEYRKRPGSPRRYTVHFDRLVLAGTFMQTYTRLTTMEAANESGRHAVNAILNASGYCGERCEISNPEQHEFPELTFFVDLDRRLLELGLPHFLDILDLRTIPKSLMRPDDVAQATAEVIRAAAGSSPAPRR